MMTAQQRRRRYVNGAATTSTPVYWTILITFVLLQHQQHLVTSFHRSTSSTSYHSPSCVRNVFQNPNEKYHYSNHNSIQRFAKLSMNSKDKNDDSLINNGVNGNYNKNTDYVVPITTNNEMIIPSINNNGYTSPRSYNSLLTKQRNSNQNTVMNDGSADDNEDGWSDLRKQKRPFASTVGTFLFRPIQTRWRTLFPKKDKRTIEPGTLILVRHGESGKQQKSCCFACGIFVSVGFVTSLYDYVCWICFGLLRKNNIFFS